MALTDKYLYFLLFYVFNIFFFWLPANFYGYKIRDLIFHKSIKIKILKCCPVTFYWNRYAIYQKSIYKILSERQK